MSPSLKRKRIVIRASEEGIKRAEAAFIRSGYNSRSTFAEANNIGRSTVDNFFNRKAIEPNSFKRISDSLNIEDWKSLMAVDSAIESPIVPISSFADASPSPVLEKSSRELVADRGERIRVLDPDGKPVLTIVLKGDINSINIEKVWQSIQIYLQNNVGSTLIVESLSAGSIRVDIRGGSDDLRRLIEKFNSGELSEIYGFPIEEIEILDPDLVEIFEAETSFVERVLVREILDVHPFNRQFSGVDLSRFFLVIARFFLVIFRLLCPGLLGAYFSRFLLGIVRRLGANLSNANLSRANLSRANLSNANLSRANLSRANLSFAILSRADLSRANLSFAILSRADLSFADLSFAILSRADLSHANLSRADLSRADLSRTTFIAPNLSEANLSEANLSEANLSGVNLIGVDLNGADLRRANLSGADLSGADLSGANLSGANLSRADLRRANLSDANLIGANLIGANLIGASLSGANLIGASVEGAIFIGSKGLSEAEKANLRSRGAIFEDALGDRALTPARR
jgi:uncharacterized protein YjbI with pentapeptide repeats